MTATLSLGDRTIGAGHPVYVIGEIGINHNGDVEVAKQLIDGAVQAGCDAVKFQKRTPEICTPRDQWDKERDTPWGRMTYIEYRHRVEFGVDEYAVIDAYCKKRDIHWTASCWDVPSVEFIEQFGPPFYKAASASLTDLELLGAMRDTGRPLMISTGMSTMEEIERAVAHVGTDNLAIFHSTSAYPCEVSELNLRMIHTLGDRYPGVPIGYSGHETGLAPTLAAVALGATFLERHITVDRAMWGSDQAASVEMTGLLSLMRNVRDIEAALGDGVKVVYESELAPRAKLRRVM
jgi:N-acetylneuraminate synthase